MESTYMFSDVSSEELYDIDGGSTKVAAVVLVIATAVLAVGSYVASKTGHPVVSACLGGAAASCALAVAWLAIAPCI